MAETDREKSPATDRPIDEGETTTSVTTSVLESPDVTWLSWGLFVSVSSFFYMLVLERPYFDQILKLDLLLKSYDFDRLTIYWLIWSKTLAVLLVLTIVCGIFHRYGWKRSSWFGFVAGSVLIYFLMLVDLRIYQSFGIHISTLLDFVDERAAADAGGGGTQGWTGPVVAMFAAVAIVAGGMLFICSKLAAPLFKVLGGVRREHLWRGVWLYGSVLFVYCPYLIVEMASHEMVRTVNRLFTVAVIDLRVLYKNPAKQWWVKNTDPRLKIMNQELQSRFQEMAPAMSVIPPYDADAVFDATNAPNVIIIALESFRFDILEKDQMPRLKALAQKGLVLNHHFSNSSRTETGLFALTFGRYPAVYNETLKVLKDAQMIRSFHGSGYETSFLSAHLSEWEGMEEFLSPKTVDHAIFHTGENWPQRDRNVLADIKQTIGQQNDKPQWVLAFLMSTHFEYQCPPEYEKHLPVDRNVKWGKLFGDPDMSELYNRYKNALLFSDDIVCDLIESIDLDRNIIIVTGDHGESFREDGMFGHVGGLSDYQSRVPMILLGAGVTPGVVDDITQHVDLLPSLLHLVSGKHIAIKHSHGRDIFSDEPAPNKALLSNGQIPFDIISFVRGDERFRVSMDWQADHLTVDGFENFKGQLINRPDASQEEIDAWKQHIERELYQLYR